MRKQVGLKFEEGDLAKWDSWCMEHSISRTQAIERAMALMLGESPPAVDKAKATQSAVHRVKEAAGPIAPEPSSTQEEVYVDHRTLREKLDQDGPGRPLPPKVPDRRGL